MMVMENLLKNKNILIMGVANKWSIAWGIAQSCLKAGANLIFTYQGERTRDAVQELVSGIPGALLYPCDVTSDQEIIDLFDNIKRD
ncbi:MAG: SDR family oxidoreductase, partial [Caldicoprobacter oshimai]